MKAISKFQNILKFLNSQNLILEYFEKLKFQGFQNHLENLIFCFSRKIKIILKFRNFRNFSKIIFKFFFQSKTLATLFWNFAISKFQNIFKIFDSTLHSPLDLQLAPLNNPEWHMGSTFSLNPKCLGAKSNPTVSLNNPKQA